MLEFETPLWVGWGLEAETLCQGLVPGVSEREVVETLYHNLVPGVSEGEDMDMWRLSVGGAVVV